MSDRVEIQIQSAVKNSLNALRFKDVSGASERVTSGIVRRLERGEKLDSAIAGSLADCPHYLLPGEPGRGRLRAELERRLGPVTSRPAESVTQILQDITKFMESQAARDLKRYQAEDVARLAVQAALSLRGDTTRESHEGAGQTDIQFRAAGSDHSDVVEVKVPRSKTEFEDGITEAAQYAQSSHVDHAHYVVVEHVSDLNSPGYLSGPLEKRDHDGVTIWCHRVRIAASSPSKVAHDRRARTKKDTWSDR